MKKVRRGGYIFLTWKGDHSPRHVHVYRDGKFVLKWDLENRKPMGGGGSQKVIKLLSELESEGIL